MKRVLYLVLTVACALLLGSCNKERQAEKLREKIRFEGVEQIVPHGMSGVDVVVSVANQTRHKITLEEAELTLKYDRNKVLMLQLRDVVELPKRFEGELEISTRMKVYDPLSAIVVLNRVRNKSFDEMSVTIDAKVKVGPVRKNIFVADMDLPKFLSKFALSTEEVDRI
ncbi:MAG: hypothetical protein J6J56_07390 [Rikenellaceae bacterium]|nr:hypothetical protein [Rikenellaceae bacterium]MBQ3255141.1 hypothetical protein [Rikenellaceae bacterium]MBQ6691224.1 hypothetical protein [Rikenellaceae bacterium]